MTHHNIAMLRGERKRPTLEGPKLAEYQELIAYVARLWREREASRFGSIVEPMLHWGKVQIAEAQSQAVPCRAGVLTGVVNANGDVALCEQHPPSGTCARSRSPRSGTAPRRARCARASPAKECFCTNEVFLWPSIVYQPKELAKAFVGSRAWRQPPPLAEGERIDPEGGSSEGAAAPRPVT